jgi:hypothetical protein
MSSRFVSQTQLTNSHYHLSTNEIAFRCVPGRRAHEHSRERGTGFFPVPSHLSFRPDDRRKYARAGRLLARGWQRIARKAGIPDAIWLRDTRAVR